MKFLTIIGGTIREGIAKKTILGMFIVSTLAILIALVLFQFDFVKNGLLSPASAHVRSGRNPQAQTMELLGVTMLDFVWMTVSMFLLFLSVFLGTFVTAGFITSIMEKGTIDLLLSKPVPRWMYITGRYCGAVLIILVEVAYLVLGLWLIAGLSLGSWDPRFLSMIFFITLSFAGTYALVTLVGVLTRSSWFAIILGLAFFMLAGLVLPFGKFLDTLLNGESQGGLFTGVMTVIHYTIPQANEMGRAMTNLLLEQKLDVVPVFTTLGLCIAYVALSSYAFSRKEF